jgi:hypothetical protein
MCETQRRLRNCKRFRLGLIGPNITQSLHPPIKNSRITLYFTLSSEFTHTQLLPKKNQRDLERERKERKAIWGERATARVDPDWWFFFYGFPARKKEK